MANKDTKKQIPVNVTRGSSNNKLIAEIERLNVSIETLKNKHFYRLANHPMRMLGLAFLKGLITGMAAIIGATALAALFVYVVGNMAVLPDWFQEFLNNIINIVEGTR